MRPPSRRATRPRCSLVPWCARRQQDRMTATKAGTGGRGCPVPPGAIRRARTAASCAATGTRSPMSPTPTRWPTPTGPARRCRRKRSGSTPLAAACTARPSSGATISRPPGGRWPTSGRAGGGRACSGAMRAPRQSRLSRRTGTGCTTWPGTSGNGPAEISGRETRMPPGLRAACRLTCGERQPWPLSRSLAPGARPVASRCVPLRAARICARRTRASASGPRPGRVSPAGSGAGHLGFRCVLRPS